MFPRKKKEPSKDLSSPMRTRGLTAKGGSVLAAPSLSVASLTLPAACHEKMDDAFITAKADELHPGTQEWLFDLVAAWYTAHTSGSGSEWKRILLLEAKSGFGKTVFVNKLATLSSPRFNPLLRAKNLQEQLKNLKKQRHQEGSGSSWDGLGSSAVPCYVGAMYFFDKFNLMRANVKTLVRSLSDQLRDSVPGFTAALMRQNGVVKDGTFDEFFLRNLNVGDLFELLVTNPAMAVEQEAVKMGKKMHRVVILLDALNDCERQYLEPLLNFISKWNKNTPNWLSMIVTVSKADPAGDSLRSLPFVEHVDLGVPRFEDVIKADIMKIIVHKLKQLTNEPEMVLKRAAEGIQKRTESRMLYLRFLEMYLLVNPASLEVRSSFKGAYIRGAANHALSAANLPWGLNALYAELFRGFRAKHPREYLLFLSPLMAARVPLPVVAWRECCSEIPEAVFNQMRADLGPVLFEYRSEIRLAHRTVFEYLRRHRNPKAYLNRVLERRTKYGAEIFSGHLEENLVNDNDIPNGSGVVSNRKRRKNNDALLIKNTTGHQALARWCWSTYRSTGSVSETSFSYALKHVIFHLVESKDEAEDVDRDKDAATLLKNFFFNLRRMYGNKSMTLNQNSIANDNEDNNENVAANVSAALNDAFNIYLRRHPEDRSVRIIQQVINKSRAALSLDPRQFAPQIIGRISAYEEDNDLREFYESANKFDPKVQMWRPVSPCLTRADVSEIERINAFSDSVRSVVVSPDGSRIAACSNDGLIKIFETNRGRALFTLDTNSKNPGKKGAGAIVSLDFIFDRERLTLASGGTDGELRLWDADSGEMIMSQHVCSRGVSAVAFRLPINVNNNIGNNIKASGDEALGDEDDSDSDDGFGDDESDGGSAGSVANFTQDERLITAVGGLDGKLKFYFVSELLSAGYDLASPITSIRWGKTLETRNILAVGNSQGGIHILDFAKDDLFVRVLKHSDRVHDICFHPLKYMLLSCSDDNTVVLWDLTRDDADVEHTVFNDLSQGKRPVLSVDFAPDGRHFATGAKDGSIVITQTFKFKDDNHTVEVYDALTAEFRQQPQKEQKLIEDLRLPPDYADGKLLLKGHEGWINAVGFFPNSERIVSCSKDKSIVIWSYNPRDALNALVGEDTRKQLNNQRKEKPMHVLEDVVSHHRQDITVVLFSPDRRLLASGDKDPVLIMWDVASGAPKFSVNLKNVPRKLEFSADGTRLNIFSDLDNVCVNTKNGHMLPWAGKAMPMDKSRIGAELVVNEYITATPDRSGVFFTMDTPRRGPPLLTPGAREALISDPETKNIYAAVVAGSNVNLVQLITSSSGDNIVDDDSDAGI